MYTTVLFVYIMYITAVSRVTPVSFVIIDGPNNRSKIISDRPLPRNTHNVDRQYTGFILTKTKS